jgi:hypothetical protein
MHVLLCRPQAVSPKALQRDRNHAAVLQSVTKAIFLLRRGSLGREGEAEAGQISVWNASGNNFTEMKKKKNQSNILKML